MAQTAKEAKATSSEDIERYKKKKSKMPLVFIFIFLMLIIGAGVGIRFNIGNLTEKYLRPSLEKVPIVNNLLLPLKVEGDQFADYTKEQLIQQIEELNSTIEKKQQLLDMDVDTISKLEDEINRLKEIEAQQVQFKKDKEEFSKMTASENPDAFKKFYEEMYPDTAAEIYKQMLGEEKQLKSAKEYAKPFETMDSTNAAKVFEQMVDTDIDLVVLILNNINSEQHAAILEEMDPQAAAKVIKKMAP